MEPEHRALLRAFRLELSAQLLVSDSIVPFLYQENILSQAQVEDIESVVTNRQKTLKLLDLLPNCGPRAFQAFLHSLDDFCWVREQLLLELQTRAGSQSTGERSPGPPAFISRRPSCVCPSPPSHRSMFDDLKRTRWFNYSQLYSHKFCYNPDEPRA